MPKKADDKGKKEKNINKLKGLQEYVALAIVDANQYQKTNLSLMKELIRQGIPGVYVTLNLPCANIKDVFKREKIDLSRVIFIDAVTQTAGGKLEKTDDCLFIGSPKNLSDISIAMDQAIMAITTKDKFLFFDSLSTLLLYNNMEVVAKFIHFLSTKMRVWKVKGIIISLRRKQDSDLIDELQGFCDVTLDL
jgi:KaiC/GvpD/RAD55 family RecA-like ATPase